MLGGERDANILVRTVHQSFGTERFFGTDFTACLLGNVTGYACVRLMYGLPTLLLSR